MIDASGGPAPASSRWRAATGLLWTRYEDSDNWVVYNPASADIHLLTAAARELWRLVDHRPGAPFPELAAALAHALGRPSDDELTAVAEEALAGMDHAGLIRRVPA
jgi:PqqD family protein of HPr-rel-A system